MVADRLAKDLIAFSAHISRERALPRRDVLIPTPTLSTLEEHELMALASVADLSWSSRHVKMGQHGNGGPTSNSARSHTRLTAAETNEPNL
jgi:hypothetical protein